MTTADDNDGGDGGDTLWVLVVAADLFNTTYESPAVQQPVLLLEKKGALAHNFTTSAGSDCLCRWITNNIMGYTLLMHVQGLQKRKKVCSIVC